MKKCIMCGNPVENKRAKCCSPKCSKARRRETWRKYDKKRNKTQKRKDWWLGWLETNRDKIRSEKRERYKINKGKNKSKPRDKEIRKMQTYANRFLREEIVAERKVCEICKGNENLQLHHKEYTQIRFF